MTEEVGGVVFDESVLFSDDGNPSLHPSAPLLLRKLRHSHLHLGISYPSGLSSNKMGLLKNLGLQCSCECFPFIGSSICDGGGVKEISLAWGDIKGRILYVVSSTKEFLLDQLSHLGWLTIVLDVEGVGAGVCENSSVLHISKLEELFLTIFLLNKKASAHNVVAVGYVMKPSREEDFAKRGAFPIFTTPNGLMFLPLTFEVSLPSQLQHIDIILHKATDEIVSVELNGSSSEFLNRITYTPGMQMLKRFMDDHSDCLVIDPLDKIYPVLDRLRIQQLLLGLEDLNIESRCRIRGPHFLKVDDFNDPEVVQNLSKAQLSLPSIVKPQVACGVAEAHSMAIVFRVEDLKDLSVPLPAVMQEYVDHSSTLYKVYALGERVFYAIKKSMPNAEILMKLSERKGPQPLLFDSLKSLPTSTENSKGGGSFDFDLVTDAAKWLARKLDLTIFGFDVVIQEGTNDHVIVDVNYLPSFKEVQDDVAIPAFWDAIKHKFDSRKKKK